MDQLPDPCLLASEMDAEIRGLPHHYVPDMRSIRRAYSERIKSGSPDYVFEFARQLIFKHGYRWNTYEIIPGHKAAFRCLGAAELEELGQGINSRWTVDYFWCASFPARPG